jgi:hypothetical protein
MVWTSEEWKKYLSNNIEFLIDEESAKDLCSYYGLNDWAKTRNIVAYNTLVKMIAKELKNSKKSIYDVLDKYLVAYCVASEKVLVDKGAFINEKNRNIVVNIASQILVEGYNEALRIELKRLTSKMNN